MTCAELRRYLSAYLDSELETTTSLAVNDHLERCDDCRERFDREERLERGIRDQLQATPANLAFWTTLDQVLAADEPRRVAPRRWVPVAAAAALLLAAFGGWALVAGGNDATSPGDARSDEMGLVVALRERASDMRREGSGTVNDYGPMDEPRARALVEQFLGPQSLLTVQPRPDAVTPHKLELVGGGTTYVGGVETPVLHYRCCSRDVCVFFVVPASMRHFPEALARLQSLGQLTCSPSPEGTVSIRRCPSTGNVIGVAGSPCAPGIGDALITR